MMLRDGSMAALRAAASGSAGSERTRPTPTSVRRVSVASVGRVLLDPLSSSSPNGNIGSDVTDVVLPAHRCVATGVAVPDILRRGRELAAVDRVDRAGQPLLGADAVDRQLQRLAALRRPSELVVDQPERPVLEKIQPIGLAFERQRPRTLRR